MANKSPKENIKKATDSDKDSQIDWQTIYSDLSTRTANSLRDARIKPSQLTTMSDGEITSIDGIGEVGLEEIRSNYSPDIMAKKEETGKEEVKSEVKEEKEDGQLPPNKRHLHRGSKKFKKVKSKVDRTKLYSIEEAVQLVKETNIAKFNATLTLHLVTKERISTLEVEFPYKTGKTKVIEVASDELLKKIDKGEINFDILLATPDMMPKLAKYARVLGPRGLMPNPKAGTITDDPKAKIKELEGGKTLVKSETKAPLMHVVVGKLEQKDEEVVANIEELIKSITPKKITKATLASTMSPGVKVYIEK